jgi:hypothetical protein
MRHSGKFDHDDPARFAALEARLRSLPAPEVPDHLLDALLCDIPDRPVAGGHRKTSWWPWWAGAAAAAVVMVVFALGRDSVKRGPAPDRSVSVEFVLAPITRNEETDPCSIFPPLADLPHSQPPS